AYVCSGNAKFNEEFSQWFRGEVGSDGKFRATREGVVLSGVLKGKSVSGRVTAGKDVRKFTGEQVSALSGLGLYRAEAKTKGADLVAGWIVVKDDSDPKKVRVVGNLEERKGKKRKNFAQKLLTVLDKGIGIAKTLAPVLEAAFPGSSAIVLKGVSVAEQ